MTGIGVLQGPHGGGLTQIYVNPLHQWSQLNAYQTMQYGKERGGWTVGTKAIERDRRSEFGILAGDCCLYEQE